MANPSHQAIRHEGPSEEMASSPTTQGCDGRRLSCHGMAWLLNMSLLSIWLTVHKACLDANDCHLL